MFVMKSGKKIVLHSAANENIQYDYTGNRRRFQSLIPFCYKRLNRAIRAADSAQEESQIENMRFYTVCFYFI